MYAAPALRQPLTAPESPEPTVITGKNHGFIVKVMHFKQFKCQIQTDNTKFSLFIFVLVFKFAMILTTKVVEDISNFYASGSNE